MGEPISNTFASFSDEDSKENKDIIPSEIEKDESLKQKTLKKHQLKVLQISFLLKRRKKSKLIPRKVHKRNQLLILNLH
jgi:hypothetical protein